MLGSSAASFRPIRLAASRTPTLAQSIAATLARAAASFLTMAARVARSGSGGASSVPVPEHSLTEALEIEEPTGFWFEKEHVCVGPRGRD